MTANSHAGNLDFTYFLLLKSGWWGIFLLKFNLQMSASECNNTDFPHLWNAYKTLFWPTIWRFLVLCSLVIYVYSVLFFATLLNAINGTSQWEKKYFWLCECNIVWSASVLVLWSSGCVSNVPSRWMLVVLCGAGWCCHSSCPVPPKFEIVLWSVYRRTLAPFLLTETWSEVLH